MCFGKTARLTGGLEDGFLVEGLDPGKVQHPGGNTLLIQLLGRLEGVPHGFAGADEGQILSFM